MAIPVRSSFRVRWRLVQFGNSYIRAGQLIQRGEGVCYLRARWLINQIRKNKISRSGA